MYVKAVILALISIAITICIEIKEYKKNGFSFIKAMIGVSTALFFLNLALFNDLNRFSKCLSSMLFTLQTMTISEDFSLINTVATDIFMNKVYVIITYILYFVAPLLSATTILSLFENTFSKLILRCSLKSEYHIFSQINKKSMMLVSNIIDTNPSAKIILMDKSNRKTDLIKNKRILKLDEKINDINLHKIKKKKYLYFVSDDEEENLNESLEYIDKLKECEKVKVYLLNDTDQAYMIMDTVMSNYYEKSENKIPNLEVEIINEKERIILQRLNILPLKKIFHQKEVTILIVGCGKFGSMFLKNIIWCFQIIGFNIKIIVVEKDYQNKKDKINLKFLHMIEKYNIKFIDKSIEDVILEDSLKEENINYAMISTGEDSNNFNVAIALRRYFLINNQDPIIDVFIHNSYKSKIISTLKNEDNNDYNINAFGDIKNTYFSNSIIDTNIEQMAKKIHSISFENDENLIEFYKSEYNRKSSRALAIHIKYKLYSILLEQYTGNIETDIENYKKSITNQDVIKALAENEHDRWMAYMYADGYQAASMKQVENYYLKLGKKHKYTLAKLHPALVENSNLRNTQQQLEDLIEKLNSELPKVQHQLETLIEKLTGEKVAKDFTKLDYEIVKRLDEICLSSKNKRVIIK